MLTRVLGIDAGFAAPGFAVVDVDLDRRATEFGELIYGECLVTKAYLGATGKKRKKMDVYKSDDDARRVIEVSDVIANLVNRYKPDMATVELPIGSGRGSSALKGMAYAASCTVVTLHMLGCPAVYVTPRNNKLASTLDPEAEKPDVFRAIRKVYPAYAAWPVMKSNPNKFDNSLCWAIADAASTVLAYLKQRV